MTVRIFPLAVARSIFKTGLHGVVHRYSSPQDARDFAQELFMWGGQRLVTDADLDAILDSLTRARNGHTNGVPRPVVKGIRRWLDAFIAEARLLQKVSAPPMTDRLQAMIEGQSGPYES